MVLSKECQDEDKSITEVKISMFSFIGKFIVIHTIIYFFAGLIFTELLGYKELFASSEYPHMRTYDSVFVMLGPLLQIFRGAIIALAFLPFRKVILENKWGWIYLFAAQWILINVAADSVTPGAFEAFIYTDIPFTHHFATYPEFTFHTLTVSWLFHAWQRHPSKKLNIAFISIFAIIAALLILGVLLRFG